MGRTEHEEYTEEIRRRYSDAGEKGYLEAGQFDFVLYGPEQYQNEEVMLEYIRKHPNATLSEVFRHWNEITPDGLATGDDGADLLEDD